MGCFKAHDTNFKGIENLAAHLAAHTMQGRSSIGNMLEVAF